MYANCRGIKGKKASLKEIVEEINPDIIVLNETMYKSNEETKLKAYTAYTNNREGRNGCGIEILVRNSVKNRTVIISERNDNIEELTIRTETKKRAINIITMYGKIEGRESSENIKSQFTHIENIIQNIESTGEDYILIGDLNAKIGNKENGIKGNNETTNVAGIELIELEKKVAGIIVNKTEKCKGKWTRVNTKNEKEKSILDYAMTNESIYDDIIEMKIDEEKLYRLTKYKGNEVKETDHNTIIITLKDDKIKQAKEKQVRWNTKDKDAWKKFHKETTNNNELDLTWVNDKDIQKEWLKWESLVNRILNKTMEKIRITNSNKQGIDTEVKEMMKEKRDTRREIVKSTEEEDKSRLIEKRKQIEQKIKKKIEENVETKINETTKKIDDKRNNFNIVWKLRNETRKKQESAFILEKEGKEIKDPKEIKNTVSDHYDKLYINNPILEGYEKYNEELEKLIKMIWEIDEKENETELEEEIIRKILKDLETKKSNWT